MDSLINLFTSKLGLNGHHCELFLDHLTTKVVKKKEHLIHEGSVCDFIAFLSSGTLRSYVKSEEHEFNNDFYFEGDFVTAYTSFLSQTPTNCNIEALEDSVIHSISYGRINNLIAEDISFLKLSKYISDTYFIRKCKRETAFLKYSASERLKQVISVYPDIEQRVSQYHIASYLGIKPESLSRIKLLTYINK